MTEQVTNTSDKEKKLDFILMWDTENRRPNTKAIINIWPYLIEGIEKIIEISDGDFSKGLVFNKILAGELFLWVAFIDGVIAGFVTARINPNLDAKTYLTINQVYSKKGVTADYFFKSWKKIEEFAKSCKCNNLRMVTMDEKWGDGLSKLGWKRSYIEYTYSLNGDNHE